MQTESSSVIIETSHISDIEKGKRQRKTGFPWKEDEDLRLLSAVKSLGTKQWVEIAKLVGTRSRKQCRERYVNHISPSIDKRPFSRKEDDAIYNGFYLLGNKWSKIAKNLEGRTARSIRNRYKVLAVNRKLSCFSVSKKSTYEIVTGGNVW
ncbi:trichome differentiation protein GL1, putative [Entamoeba invadens IP1]|uniref:Trichome differentiation protein GL1, putative n=1 Tax=Entamoeba invadens IP1 TaxID=370355 RepID=A0A0A1UAT4_ENTIV|nr:trichome differentiation protein GL1, putative [Entamoeba invadens IP1]ELP92095.1 trichome differentiation protein GL1, putative [Entamoeba invadens IP1]|eukprot:XP_004258866.1 trichome differentiation protein GL1, putative [Entamoeba invadens IP1]